MLARPQLCRGVDPEVEPGKRASSCPGDILQLRGRHDPVEEAGGDRIVGGVDFGVDDRSLEVRRRQAVAQISTPKNGIVMPIATSLAPILYAPATPTR